MKKIVLSLIAIGCLLETEAARAQFTVTDVPAEARLAEMAAYIKTLQGDMSTIKSMTSGNLVPNLASLALQSTGTKQIALLMAKSIDLDKYNQILIQAPNGTTATAPADTLVYDPSNPAYTTTGGFAGGNQGFIDNLVGGRGLPIGLDNDAPYVLVPLIGPEATIAQSAAGKAAPAAGNSALNSFILSPAFSTLMGPFQQSIANLAPQIAQTMVGDGVFARPYAGKNDDIYNAMASSTTASNVLTYYATTGSSYHPLVGNSSGALSQLAGANLSNILSNGQYGAVLQYLQQSGGGSNPYATFGRDMTSSAIQTLGSASVGQPLKLTSSQVTQVASNGGGAPSVSNVPSLFPTSTDTTSASTSTASSGNQMVAAVTLTQDQMNQFNNAMRSSNEKIRQNWIESQKAQTLLTYAQQQIGSSGSGGSGLMGLAQQVSTIRSKMATDDSDSAPNESMPQVTQLLSTLQTEISARQQFANQLQMRIDDLASNRSRLLEDREQARNSYVQQVQNTAGQRAYSIIGSTSAPATATTAQAQ